jgi:C1A family cysteine protease
VDCSSGYGNIGCNGGWMNSAFKYIIAVGIATEANYKYTGIQSTCKKLIAPLFNMTSYNTVTSGCSNLAAALVLKPLAVAVNADSWQYYKSGILNNCTTKVNHGVLLVANSAASWTIKNSWGTTWGEKGYIRLAPGNTCNICTYGSYPNV